MPISKIVLFISDDLFLILLDFKIRSMENFNIYNPTKVHFGKDVCDELGKTISNYGKRVLLVYGKGSIKKFGLYQKAIEQLKSVGAEIFEYSGIKSNPIIEDVDAAAEVGRKNNIDVILAIGGGSVIDSAKVISVAVPVENQAWDFFQGKVTVESAIPIIAVLTLAATGTEMNCFAVVQNHKTGNKAAFGHPFVYPKHSFLDPQNTFSVPRNYTAYGIMDLVAHSLEAYFGTEDSDLADKFIYSIIKEAIEFGPELLNNLHDYELRAKILYASTMALNGTTSHGRKISGDWGVHQIGHIFSLLYDIPHGATLSIGYSAWFKLMKTRAGDRITTIGKELFGATNVDDSISGFEKLFQQIESPIRLNEVNLNENHKKEILDSMIHNKVNGNHYKLSVADYERLIEFML